MAKNSRRSGAAGGRGRKARDRRTPRHISVFDAANVNAHADQLVTLGTSAGRDGARRWIGHVAGNMVQEWRKAPVVLRADLEFVGALLDSDTNVELVPDWTRRLPFDNVAYSFPEPVSVHDGKNLPLQRVSRHWRHIP